MRALGAVSIVVAVAACGVGGGVGTGDLVMRVDTIGDTIIVRSERGSVWSEPIALEQTLLIGQLEGRDEYVFGRIDAIEVGEDDRIYVLDGQVPVIRVYDRDGHHLHAIGRRGEGPGEILQPTGLAVMPDGRVLVSDPRNARVNVYSPAGEPLESWRMAGGFFTSNQVRVASDGSAYVHTLLSEPMSDVRRSGFVRVGPDGTPPDTLAAPTWPDEPAPLVARFEQGQNRSISMSSVPFGPQIAWTFHPAGYIVGGLSTRYAIDVFRRDGSVLRIERTAEPVSVTSGERAFREHQTTTNMRRTDPAWRWSGASIPATKAPFTALRTDHDGRIWVRVAVPGEMVPPAERTETPPGTAPGPEPWREPLAYDVFEADGRFLGRLRFPPRFTLHGARGDEVWGVLRDELDVGYVALLRLGM